MNKKEKSDELVIAKKTVFKNENAMDKSLAESYLQTIFENTSEGFILVDTNGVVKMFNTKSADIIFLNTELKIKIDSIIYDFIHPSRKKSYQGVLSKVLAGEAMQFDYAVERKNGDIKWFIYTINPAFNKAGEIEGACITTADITERKIAENKLSNTSIELQKTLSELNKIVDYSLDVICTITTDGEFVNVSAASQNIWGYSPAELIGNKFMDLVYEKDKDSTYELTEKILNGIEVPIFENRYVHKNGKMVPMLWSMNWDENLQLLYCIAKDITEKKRREKATENERDQFYQMFIKAPSAIGMLKGANHVFEMANPLYLQSIGKKDVIGKTVAEVLPEVIEQGFIEILDYVYRTGESYTGTEMLVKVANEENGKLTDFYINFIYQAYRNSKGEIEGIFFFINDITEQVVSRKKIEKSEQQYRQILETAQEGIWLIDENSRTTFVNKKMCEILEYTEEELMDKEHFYFMDADGKEKAVVALERRKRGIAESIEFGFISKNGKHVFANVSATPIFGEMGSFIGSLGMVSDISDTKRLENLLEKSNRLAQIGSWEIDIVKGTVYWSDITKEICEVDLDFIPDLSTGIGFFTEGKNKNIILQRVQECIDNGIPWDEELQLTTFKGNLKWVRTIGEAEFVQGKCSKVYGSSQDISVRKLAEQSLQQSQSNLKAIIENTEAAIYSLDTEFRYIAFNKLLHDSLQEIFDLDIKIGDPVLGFLAKLDIKEAKSWTKKYLKALKGQTIKFEDELIVGKFSRYLSFSINPIWEDKTIIGLSCFVYDITEQKQEQQQKEKMSADLIQRNRDLEQFTFIISHNLRAPAANIIGCAELLQDETLTPIEKEGFLQGLSESVTTLDTVIKDINNILQVKSEVNKKKEVIILSKLVNNIMVSIGSLIDKHRVHIIYDFSEVDEIYSLKIYIRSIFYNLISNSIKYSKPNEPPLIEIKSKKENGKIILIFKDNGLGIDMKEQGGKIFGLYRRFHPHVEGKGMGLFMVKTQVELLGGEITIASEPNKGTEFTIVFENKI